MRSGRSDIQSIAGATSVFAIAETHFFKFPKVTASSRVVASVSEVDSNGKPFIGNATLSVDGVAPNDNGDIVVRVVNYYDAKVRYIVTWFVSP